MYDFFFKDRILVFGKGKFIGIRRFLCLGYNWRVRIGKKKKVTCIVCLLRFNFLDF